MDTHVVILAAGQGSRMKSDMPKVLHQLAGRSMLAHVLESSATLEPALTQIVVGFGGDQIRLAFGENRHYVVQAEQLGTGHAVQCTAADIKDDSVVVVLYGDVPLIQPETIRQVVESAAAGLSLLTTTMDDPSGYGRIVRDEPGSVVEIVEDKDATQKQLNICEVNTGILAARGSCLKRWLTQLSNSNAQGEYYLTDIVAMAVQEGLDVATVSPEYDWEVAGANSRVQLAELERAFQRAQADRLMAQGVSLADPARFDLRGNLSVGKDVFIDINVIIEGDVVLGDRVVVGPNCVIKNASIGNDVLIKANTHIEGALIDANAQLGPYARLREGTYIGDSAKVGNFVETKKAHFGAGVKASHLSYIGDAEIGAETNIGAGTITCNYDGKNKFKTILGKNVFIGSNTALVAPVEIKDGATVGAGSVITKNVEGNALAIARAKQRNIDDWKN